MASKSDIEWTDASWNPIRARNIKTGKIGWYCEHSTTGCEFCYSEGMNKHLGTGLSFKPGHRKDVDLFLDEKMLFAPQHWKKPRMIFVCSMTDLFADFVPDEWIDKMFAVMGQCDDSTRAHTFQILTKRAQRMRDYMNSKRAHKAWNDPRLATEAWPPRNIWLGVSAERQVEADERIPHLLETPATVRFISAEPLLGPIDLTEIEAPDKVDGERWTFNALAIGDYYTQWSETLLGERRASGGDGPYREHKVDWIIVGGESGPNARQMNPEWARALRDQCQDNEVAYFFKQWGEWAPYDRGAVDSLKLATPCSLDKPIQRFGKKLAGRLLDGREHNDMPKVA